MKKWPFAALLVVGAAILGATVLREPIAKAAQVVDANIIGPLDTAGNLKVHEQGVAQVRPEGEPITIELQQGLGNYLVPRGKRLVIQYVNGSLATSTTQPVLLVTVGQTEFRFLGASSSLDPGDFTVSEDVTIFAQQGERISVDAGSGLNPTATVRLSAYLMPL
jgi:hypothetical protein